MPSVRNDNVNSHEAERRDNKFTRRVQAFDWWCRNGGLTNKPLVPGLSNKPKVQLLRIYAVIQLSLIYLPLAALVARKYLEKEERGCKMLQEHDRLSN